MPSYVDYPTVDVEGKRFYQLGDQKYYPSITTILGNTLEPEKAQALENWRNWLGKAKADKVRDDAATRGTNTHLMIERKLKGEDVRESEFPVEHVRIFNSLKFELQKINTVLGQEVVLYSDLVQVAGRCDLIAEYDGELSVVDYKTSSRVKSKDEIGDYWLQAAFYAIAHNEMYGTEITKLVILMGVEKGLPLVFRKRIDEEMVAKLLDRVDKFYVKMGVR